MLLSWLPIPCIAAIEAMVIKAAMRPYSMAVAPAESRTIFLKNCISVSIPEQIDVLLIRRSQLAPS